MRMDRRPLVTRKRRHVSSSTAFSLLRRAAVIATGLLCVSMPAWAADLGGSPIPEPGAKPNLWLVTVGGFAVVEPRFEGSDKLEAGFRPIFSFRKAGSREWMSLPNDGFDFELIETDNFRAGPVANVRWARGSSGQRGFKDVGTIDLSLEAGAFVEYWPARWFRTRAELRGAVVGGDGFVADFSADAVWRPAAAWRFAAGPRLTIADADFMASYYGIDDQQAAITGLPTYHAGAGIKSVGAGTSAQYKWSEAWTTTAFVEYQRLAGSAGDSPLIDNGGSADQVKFGLGVTYTFAVSGF
jgi:outer membrane protein